VPFRIIREAIGGEKRKARSRKRVRTIGRKRDKESRTERKGRRTEKERDSRCYFALLFHVYFLSFREGPKKSSHAARERDPEHARRHARTHALAPPRESESPRRARDLDFFLLVDFFPPLGSRRPCRGLPVQRAKVSSFSPATTGYDYHHYDKKRDWNHSFSLVRLFFLILTKQ